MTSVNEISEILTMVAKWFLGVLMMFIGIINLIYPDFNTQPVICTLLIFGGIGTVMWSLS